MPYWVVSLKPNRRAPYLERAEDEYDAEERKQKAENDGCTAKVYHTATHNIREAKRQLRRHIADDFSYMVSNSNFQEARDRKSTRLNSSHIPLSRMPSSA